MSTCLSIPVHLTNMLKKIRTISCFSYKRLWNCRSIPIPSTITFRDITIDTQHKIWSIQYVQRNLYNSLLFFGRYVNLAIYACFFEQHVKIDAYTSISFLGQAFKIVDRCLDIWPIGNRYNKLNSYFFDQHIRIIRTTGLWSWDMDVKLSADTNFCCQYIRSQPRPGFIPGPLRQKASANSRRTGVPHPPSQRGSRRKRC